MNEFLSDLNPEQKEAVEYIDGPLLILAGAGTGKTKVLTTRIANIIIENKATPNQILAVTFTNKASKEMLERIHNIIGNFSSHLWIGTFHSISVKILRQHAENVGLSANFSIIDVEDQIRLLKQILKDLNIDEKIYQAKRFAYIISNWKDKSLTTEDILEKDIPHFANHSSLTIYKEYQARLKQLNAVDFGDLLLHTINILSKNQEISQYYNDQFKYLLVDEYQDTNVAQYLWLRLLCQQHKNICCVGDDDQSIYGWRGAEVGNILRFEKDFPNAKTIKLERNYRSTSSILNIASNLIAKNDIRHPKKLWTELNEGEKVTIISCYNDRMEAEAIANEIDTLKLRKTQYQDIAILVRAAYQTRVIEECFIRWNIPYNIIGGLKFYDRKEIKDIIAYIRIIVQQNDDLALQRIINIPGRGIGDVTLGNIYNYARQGNINFLVAIKEMLALNQFPKKQKEAIETLVNNIKIWHEMFKTMPIKDVVEDIIIKSGYQEMLDKENNGNTREDNLREFTHALTEFNSIEEFLEHISLVNDSDNIHDKNVVSVMTLHAAKGLEFNHVFLPGWEEGIFPSGRTVEENGKKGIEEERRLAYVGITRAKQNLYILLASQRRIYNDTRPSTPSRFLYDIPENQLNLINQGGYDLTKIYKNVPSSNASSYFNHQKQKPKISTNYITNNNNHLTTDKNTAIDTNLPITHKKFGKGVIKSVVGDISEVKFETHGIKFIMNKFITQSNDESKKTG